MDISSSAFLNTSFVPQERRGWIYLLQERHELLQGSSIYKVGKTNAPLSEPFQRMAGYRGGVDLHLMIQVPLEKLDALETDIKLALELRYGAPVYGSESFSGPLEEMRLMVLELCNEGRRLPGGFFSALVRSSAGAGTGTAKKGATVIVEKAAEI
jgi:hypothetical protein